MGGFLDSASVLRLSTAGERSEGEQKCMCFLAILFVSNRNSPKEKRRHVKRGHVNWTTWTKMEAFESIWRCNYSISYKEIVGDFPASHVSLLEGITVMSCWSKMQNWSSRCLHRLRWCQRAGDQKGAWRVGGTWQWRVLGCALLLMERNPARKTRWYGKYTIIYRVFIHTRWLFGISEPSTVSVHFLCFPRIQNARQTLTCA